MQRKINIQLKKKAFIANKQIKRSKVISEKGLKCHWCGIKTDNSIYVSSNQDNLTTIDHIYCILHPKRKNNPDLVVIACQKCNKIRGNIDVRIFGKTPIIISSNRIVKIHPTKKEQVFAPVAVQQKEVVVSNYNPFNPPKITGPKVVVNVPLTFKQRLFSIRVKFNKLFRTMQRWAYILCGRTPPRW